MGFKISFLVPYPIGESPSQRFRFEQYFDVLSQNNHQVTIHSFFGPGEWRLFYEPGNFLNKLRLLVAGFINRGKLLFQIGNCDFVFIHREAAPVGPPLVEWAVAKILHKKIIYDFDDAIWTTDRSGESLLVRIVKFRRKVSMICSWAHTVSCGNDFLCQYAGKFNTGVRLNPSTIDHHYHQPGDRPETQTIAIGWTGSHSTIKYLMPLVPVINRLLDEFKFLHFIAIADRLPQIGIRNLQFIEWRKETEIQDLSRLDIGIMPLTEDEWSQGKCGFKILQYMAMGIPSVASPVGVNRAIVRSGVNGYLSGSEDEWYQRLKELILNPSLRIAMGESGRTLVIRSYSVESNAANFLSLFE